MKFEGKSVVLTGASSGMGWEIAKMFASEGATVVAVARRKERLEQLAKETENMPGKIIPYVGDVSSEEVNVGMIECAVKECGKLDILVNNAGVMDEFKPIGEVTNELWEKIMKINLEGPMFAMRKAVEVMTAQENGGNIINIASIGGIRGGKAGAAYTASKHALVGLTKNTAYMYVNNKIRCNVVCPGGVETEVMNSQTNISQMGIGRVMAGVDQTIRQGQSSEIAATVAFLADDAAAFINGAEIVIDGGVTI
ncbi:MAG: SDR family oxidoreductase [Ruminococcaceae bacterium]|nr:SDR family oxidoreductase [Oscillospiraceae bacterium]